MWVASVMVVGMKLRAVSLQPADQTPPTQSDKGQCHIDRVVAPDDEHMVARKV